jgi:phage/plasmid primase-like uncharacterized protein
MQNYNKDSVYHAATGRWPEILNALAGMDAAYFRKKHQPCPMCGGHDRYRFIDSAGSGDYICGQCGAGYGIHLFTKYSGIEFSEAINMIGSYLGVNPESTPPAHITKAIQSSKMRTSRRDPAKAAAWLSKAVREPINLYCANRFIAPSDLLVTNRDVIITPIHDGEQLVDAAAISPTGEIAFASGENPLNAWTLCTPYQTTGKSVFICIDWADAWRITRLTSSYVLCAWTADNMIELANRFKDGFVLPGLTETSRTYLALNKTDYELNSGDYTSLKCIIPDDNDLIRYCTKMQRKLYNPSDLMESTHAK